MSGFWPSADPQQQVYERLRSAAMASGRPPDKLAAAREVNQAEIDERPLPAKLRDALARLFSPDL